MLGSFLSVWWNVCVHRLDLDNYLLSSERVLGNGVRIHVNSKGKNPFYLRLGGGTNPQNCITQDSESSTLLTELSWPHVVLVYHIWAEVNL